MDWIKIMCNILDHRKIKMIRKGPEGNTLVLLWLLMLVEAGKCNRGGYLMISDCLPYTVQTLSMVTDIPLPTVQLGLSTFANLEMVDQQDGVIFVKNWGKYQSEDKLEARRQKDRIRQQRHRENMKSKLLQAATSEHALLSRDTHADMSRDVTQENRKDFKKENTTIDAIRSLLSGTPFFVIADFELLELERRHGIERLKLAADLAAETWRRDPAEIHNLGGYLQSLSRAPVLPSWYQTLEERAKKAQMVEQSKITAQIAQNREKNKAEHEFRAKETFWRSLTEVDRETFRAAASATLTPGLDWPTDAVQAIAKSIAWERHISVT